MSDRVSAVALPAFIRSILDRIIEDEKISDHSLEVKSGSNTGDGFVGEMVSVVITGKCDSKEKKLNLVCKLAPANQSRRREFSSHDLFSHEAYFYNKLMPTFANFQREKNLSESDQFTAFAKCYAAVADEQTDQYVIVMDDLRADGFLLWDKAKPSTIDNIRLAVSEIGKFHGISFALKHQRPDIFDEFKNIDNLLCKIVKSSTVKGVFDSGLKRGAKALRSEEHKAIILDLQQNLLKHLENCLNNSTKFAVVCHGDCWNNNLMFRFNEKNVAEDIRFIDWQILGYVSPATDVLYCIFASTDKPLRDKEYNNLLQLYYQSLSKTIRLLGSDPDDLFTFDDLLSEMQRCGNLALIIAPMAIQMGLAETSEIANLDDICDKEKSLDLIKSLSGAAQQKYEDRLNDSFNDLIALGYYNKIDD